MPDGGLRLRPFPLLGQEFNFQERLSQLRDFIQRQFKVLSRLNQSQYPPQLAHFPDEAKAEQVQHLT